MVKGLGLPCIACWVSLTREIPYQSWSIIIRGITGIESMSPDSTFFIVGEVERQWLGLIIWV